MTAATRQPTELHLPRDEHAERQAVAHAAATRHGCALARQRLNPEHLWNPTLRGVYTATLEVDQDDDGWPEEVRLRAIATLARVSPKAVQQLVDERSLMWDKHGRYAAAVNDAHQRRALMARLAAAYQALGEGADTNQALAALLEQNAQNGSAA